MQVGSTSAGTARPGREKKPSRRLWLAGTDLNGEFQRQNGRFSAH
jgi:hypothetical protein